MTPPDMHLRSGLWTAGARPLARGLVLAGLSRASSILRARRAVLREAAWPVIQAGIAASLAWALAVLALGHPRPLFAAISAVVSLGATLGERGRRALELVFGVAIGIGVADGLVAWLGTGTAQIGVVVTVAIGVAVLIGGGPMLITQAGVSAVLVVALEAPGGGYSPDRFLDALVGGGVALLVNSLLFPPNPLLMVGRAAQPLFHDLAGALEETSRALADGDLQRAERALARARNVDDRFEQFSEALGVGEETARLAPPRRGTLRHLERYAAAAHGIDLVVRGTRVLARASVRAVRLRSPALGVLSEAVSALARAVWCLAAQLDDPDRRPETVAAARESVRLAGQALELVADLSTSAVVAQLRATAVDVLRAAGLGPDEATAVLESPDRIARVAA